MAPRPNALQPEPDPSLSGSSLNWGLLWVLLRLLHYFGDPKEDPNLDNYPSLTLNPKLWLLILLPQQTTEIKG